MKQSSKKLLLSTSFLMSVFLGENNTYAMGTDLTPQEPIPITKKRSSNLKIDNIHDHLLEIERTFDTFQHKGDKKRLITTPVEFFWTQQVFSEITSSHKTMMPLWAAIRTGNVSLVSKFLTAIDNVNSLDFIGHGFNQQYLLSHLVMDPTAGDYGIGDAPFEDRLQIVSLLGEKGADFNAFEPKLYKRDNKPKQLYDASNRPIYNPLLDKTTPYPSRTLFFYEEAYKGSPYTNPPLTAGSVSGRSLFSEAETTKMKIRAMLYGADPRIGGSSYSGFRLENSPPGFFEEFLKDWKHQKELGASIRLTDYVLENLLLYLDSSINKQNNDTSDIIEQLLLDWKTKEKLTSPAQLTTTLFKEYRETWKQIKDSETKKSLRTYREPADRTDLMDYIKQQLVKTQRLEEERLAAERVAREEAQREEERLSAERVARVASLLEQEYQKPVAEASSSRTNQPSTEVDPIPPAQDVQVRQNPTFMGKFINFLNWIGEEFADALG